MNLDEAARFLGVLAPRGPITYQTFDDGPNDQSRLARKCHGPLSAQAADLCAKNDSGAGVFVMVNQGNGKGRAAKDVVRVRAVFVDLDGAPLEPVLRGPLPPSITVETSPSRFHAYWLTEDVSLADFKAIQKSLAERFKGDPTVNDLCRVMRLPGFIHRKAAPFTTRILSLERHSYTREQLETAFGPFKSTTPTAGPRTGERIPLGKRNAELFRRARGFVNNGLTLGAVNRRLQRINAEHCEIPLCATEIDAISAAACSHPSKGSLSVPVALLDSDGYRGLKLSPQALLFAAIRRQGGNADAPISLPFEDFKGRIGNKAFYKYRKALVFRGLLVPAGKFGDADLFLVQVSK